MGFGDIETVEIPVLSRHFVGLEAIEPHTFEAILDLHKSPSNRMEMIPVVFGHGQSHILELVRETISNELILDDYELLLKSRSDANLAFINSFPDRFLIFVGEVFYSFQEFSQRPVLPENSISEVDESNFGSKSGDLNEGVLFEGLEVLEHKIFNAN